MIFVLTGSEIRQQPSASNAIYEQGLCVLISPVFGTPSSETAIQVASAVSWDWSRLGNALRPYEHRCRGKGGARTVGATALYRPPSDFLVASHDRALAS